MKGTYSKSRQQAEITFGNVQTEFFAKNNETQEATSEAQVWEAKTLRLREPRLAKEQAEGMSATSIFFAKRSDIS
ncbi:hypothetical protein [Ensifer soli]|uniref:hypothetical protein n=1 Tax=Ciceribacter sp. sgz301302 TaxID=3342379 RepID=UPI0035B8BEEA